MGSFSGLGIGLSFVFGCIFLGLVAGLYYLLWWKKRTNNSREIEEDKEDDHFSSSNLYAKEISSYLFFCWKKPNSIDTQEFTASVKDTQVHDLELGGGNGKDLQFKGFGDESVESELMRLHNLCGPPRFLFTIKEETKEDLESDDGKSRSRKGSRTRSLSDIIIAVDNTTFLTPLPSPPILHGFNPLFESITTEAELRSSPPPKFKFLRDAEEKLIRRLLVEEAEKRALKDGVSFQDSVIKPTPNGTVFTEEMDSPFIALCHSTPSQVLPLASSPSTFRLADAKSDMEFQEAPT
ncbi:hypothetical protein ACH5RR_020797 [Cinchona calisaya]|uniref:Uncharacterized protein n=1 Tax=Cinchona calisaya TaxID=153742 RepID=A0ABD2ZKH6_9GENT